MYFDTDHTPEDVVQFVSASLSTQDNEVNNRPLRIFRLPHPRTSKDLQSMKAKAKALYVIVLICPIGLPSLFLPFESSGANGEEISKILEIQAVSPPEERSWMLGERVIAGMSYRQASSLYINVFFQMGNC